MKRMRRFMALLLTVTLVGSNAVFVQAAGTEQDAVESTADNAADNLQSDAAGDNTAATQDSTEKNTEAEEETLETAEIGTKNSYQGKAVSIMAGETAEITSGFDTVKSWRSEDEGIAKVDDNGEVTGVAVGRTKVTAEDDEGNTQTFEISVSELQYFDTTIFDYKGADNTVAHYDAMDGARYLDDLKLDDAYSGWGSIGKGCCGACEKDGRHNVEIGVVPDRNSYAVVTYEKGISMHADGRAMVDVPDGMRYFSGVAAVNQCQQGSSRASMEFRVTVKYGNRRQEDKTYTYRVGNTSGFDTSAEPFCINVSGAESIVLEVDRYNNDNSEDHGVWADAKFTYANVDQEARMDTSAAGHGSINDITYAMDSNTENGIYFANGTNRGKYQISGTQNTWTGENGGVVKGIAADELDGSAIKLNYTEPGLFTLTPNEAKDVFTDVSFPFIEDADGYYTFDSTQMTAAFDDGVGKSGTALEFYNQRTEFSKVGQTNGDKSGFFPFNDTNGASTYSDDLNYWFGMSMSVDFYMLNGGYMDTAHTEPITFDFSGDDDVWIYIDGKLVLDMGGIHDMATGSINFGTGRITLTPADGEIERTELSRILGEGWVNDNGIHSLQIFYMERGEGASNLKVKFNLPQKDQLIVEKQFDNTSASESEREELLKENFTFQLKRGDTEGNLQNYAEAVYALFENGAMIGRNLTTDSEGKFTLKYNQRAVFSLEMPRPDSHYYQVSEIEPGKEYTAAWDTSTNNAQTDSGEGTEAQQTFIGAKKEYLRTNVDVYTYTFHNYRDTVLEDDTVVIDYGKEIDIDVFANDEVYASREINLSDSSNKNGTFEGKRQQVAFTPSKFMDQIETTKYNVTDAQGNNQSATVTVIPATTVYYEDDFPGVTFSEGWDVATSESTSAGQVQDDGTVGAGNNYGYDSTYDGDLYYSGGSAHYIQAKDDEVQASFTFTGTGFDIISRTDNETGIIRAVVTNDKGEKVYSKMVDTVYQTEGEALYQIPVINCTGLEYGTYTVTISVAPANALTERCTFYLDALRIYNPLGSDNDTANGAYDADDEKDLYTKEIRNLLIEQGDLSSMDEGFVYVDLEDYVGNLQQYREQGPNNEVYLSGYDGVCTTVKTADGKAPDSVQIGAKAPNGKAYMSIGIGLDSEGDNMAWSEEIALSTATDMYYDLTDMTWTYLGEDGNDVIVKWDDLPLDWENGVPVYIGGLGNLESEEESAADAVIALTYLKTTGKAVSCVVNPETMNILKNIRAELLGSDQGGGLKIYSAEPKKNTYNRNTTMNFIITTGADAAEMKVVLDKKEQKVLKTITDTNADGTVTWTLTVRAPRQKGEYTYNVYASDSAGNQSEPSNISVKVK